MSRKNSPESETILLDVRPNLESDRYLVRCSRSRHMAMIVVDIKKKSNWCDKIETIRNKLDVLSSNPPACTELSFHGRPPSLISDL